ncbi:extracellular solute-binding protein [Nocardia panacis]|uniref:extracellular solute-binding protein n=1 Tax=Nocardia panacis TaxID=2340916 RepID=UPI00131514AA|nr:extracellular solute-binding protein [Nocardia panacis]
MAANYGGSTGDSLKSILQSAYQARSGTAFQQVAVGTGFAAKLEAQSKARHVSWSVIEGLSGSDAAQADQLGLLEHLSPELRGRLEAVSLPGAVTDYGVALGDTGYVIACRAQVKCPDDPIQFWNTKDFPGRRAVPNVAPVMLASALIADGVRPDQVYPIDVGRALNSMARLRPDVWTTSGDQQMQVVRDGQVDMAIMWNGRAKAVTEQGTPLTLRWGGSVVNPNYMVVVKGGPNSVEAMKYLEFYATDPQLQAKLAAALGYGMSHRESLASMKPADADALPAAHAESQLRLRPEWWAQNAGAVGPQWERLVAG